MKRFDDAPDVHPCRTKRCHDDLNMDHVDISCDGRIHYHECVRGGVVVLKKAMHSCDRWVAHAQAWMRLS